MENIKIRHLRDGQGNPWGTMAFDSDGKVGVAVCGPHDKFSKNRGREIAIGRLKTNPAMVSYAERNVDYRGTLMPMIDALQLARHFHGDSLSRIVY